MRYPPVARMLPDGPFVDYSQDWTPDQCPHQCTAEGVQASVEPEVKWCLASTKSSVAVQDGHRGLGAPGAAACEGPDQVAAPAGLHRQAAPPAAVRQWQQQRAGQRQADQWRLAGGRSGKGGLITLVYKSEEDLPQAKQAAPLLLSALQSTLRCEPAQKLVVPSF